MPPRSEPFGTIARLRGVAGCLLPAALLLGCTNVLLPRQHWFWDRLQRDDDTFNAVRRLEETTRPGPGAVVYVIGDSSLREGVDAAQLTRTLGRPVVKLCFAGGTPLESLLVATRLQLHAGDTLVVGLSPYEFRAEANEMTSIEARPLVNMLLGVRTSARVLGQRTGSAWLDDFAQSALRDASFAYRYRGYMQELILGGYQRAEWVEFRYQARIAGRDFMMRLTDGSYKLSPETALMSSSHVSYRALSSLQAHALKRKARLVILEVPRNPVLDDSGLLDPGVMAAYARLLARFTVVSPGTGLADELHFNDFAHLNPAGRAVYTQELATALTAPDPT